MFNVESDQELRCINDVAAGLGRKARVALRVNPDVDPKTHPYIATGLRQSKFGIDIGQAAGGVPVRQAPAGAGGGGRPPAHRFPDHADPALRRFAHPDGGCGPAVAGARRRHPLHRRRWGAGDHVQRGDPAPARGVRAGADRRGARSRRHRNSGARTGPGRQRRNPGDPCPLYQAVAGEELRGGGRGNERPRAAESLRLVSRHLAGPPGVGTGRGDRRRGGPHLRVGRLPGQGPGARSLRAGGADGGDVGGRLRTHHVLELQRAPPAARGDGARRPLHGDSPARDVCRT